MRHRGFGHGQLQRNKNEKAVMRTSLKEDGKDILTAWIWGNISI